MNRHRRLPPLGALRAFEAAARHMSFRRAATELAVTPTAVSHQIRLLEETLGQPLFVRHVRRVALTEAGDTLYPALRDGFDALDRAVETLRERKRRPSVTLTATTLFTARRLLPALDEFRRRNPDLDLILHASDEIVDLTSGTAAIAVRYAAGPFDGLIAEPLIVDRFGVLCSPGLGVRRVRDLVGATLLHIQWKRPGDDPDWSRWAKAANIADLPVAIGPRFTDDSHALQAAVAGMGVAIGSLELARQEMEAGLLVNPFGPILPGEAYHVVTTPRAAADPHVAAVKAWLKACVAGVTPCDDRPAAPPDESEPSRPSP